MKYSFSAYRFFLIILVLLSKGIDAQYITVDNQSYTDQQLVEKFIGTKNLSCVSISSVKFSGGNLGSGNSSYGYFNNGSSLGMDEGIILSTGSFLAAAGPKTKPVQSVTASGWMGDQDLADATGLSISNLANATILEFDFRSTLSDKISFRYMFLSEEYRPDNCQYSDAFAFLLKKANNSEPYTNIALVPGTNIPVTSTTINGAYDGSCTPQNIDYFGGFIGLDNPSLSPTNFNGQTKVLTAVADIDAGELYHIKLVIADEGRNANSQYDSAVFLEAGSFTGNVDLLPELQTDDAVIICNGNPIKLEVKDPSIITGSSPKFFWTESDAPSTIISTDSFLWTNTQGNYRLRIELSTGCTLSGNIKVENAPVAIIDTSPIMICDDDFDGRYVEKLSNFTGQIVTNFNGDFTVEYYTQSGTKINPDSDFIFTQNPQILYVKVGAFSCAPKIYQIQFYYGNRLGMTPDQSFDVCDEDLSNSEPVNLANYLGEITTETGYTTTYFATEAQAKAGGNSTINAIQTIDSNKVFFIRIEKNGACPNYVKVNLNFKKPKKSALLLDEPYVICKGETKDLDAGLGFTSYRWYRESSPSITIGTNHDIQNLSPDSYVVELEFNDCKFPQKVKIIEDTDPVIDNVLIDGTTITVLVSGGTKPYQYALDNGSYQTSNIFTNVDLGSHTIYVQDLYGCSVFTKDFTLINTQNVITPNDDGINDFIDYSDLLTKIDPRFEIYDRNGKVVFRGSPENRYIWNGKSAGRELPTSSYWYLLQWNESSTSQRTQKSGWILLKNRN